MSDEHADFHAAAAGSSASRCPVCHGDLVYDAATRGMLCTHCGHTQAAASPAAAGRAVEHALRRGLAEARQRGYGTAVRTTRCEECGAQVSFAGTLTATRCEFCGSSRVLKQEENRNLIRPETLVPFQIDRESAQAMFSGWLRGLWLRPSALVKEARVAEMSGVYVPYWTFDARVDSSWRAEAGYYYYVTETYTERDAQGQVVTKERQVRKVRWEPAHGSRTDRFDDVLVCASRGLPEALAQRLVSFDTSGLRPYDPSFLAGWKAEEYAIELDDAWGKAAERMTAAQDRRCRGDVPGDTQRSFRASHDFRDETFKHVLLPVWIASYRYREQVYRFLVNGQTGEVTGKAPWSVLKIALLILFLAAIVAGIVWWTQRGP